MLVVLDERYGQTCNSYLTYYDKESSDRQLPKGAIDLSMVKEIRNPENTVDLTLVFRDDSTYELRAPTVNEARRWTRVLEGRIREAAGGSQEDPGQTSLPSARPPVHSLTSVSPWKEQMVKKAKHEDETIGAGIWNTRYLRLMGGHLFYFRTMEDAGLTSAREGPAAGNGAAAAAAAEESEYRVPRSVSEVPPIEACKYAAAIPVALIQSVRLTESDTSLRLARTREFLVTVQNRPKLQSLRNRLQKATHRHKRATGQQGASPAFAADDGSDVSDVDMERTEAPPLSAATQELAASQSALLEAERVVHAHDTAAQGGPDMWGRTFRFRVPPENRQEAESWVDTIEASMSFWNDKDVSISGGRRRDTATSVGGDEGLSPGVFVHRTDVPPWIRDMVSAYDPNGDNNEGSFRMALDHIRPLLRRQREQEEHRLRVEADVSESEIEYALAHCVLSTATAELEENCATLRKLQAVVARPLVQAIVRAYDAEIATEVERVPAESATEAPLATIWDMLKQLQWYIRVRGSQLQFSLALTPMEDEVQRTMSHCERKLTDSVADRLKNQLRKGALTLVGDLGMPEVFEHRKEEVETGMRHTCVPKDLFMLVSGCSQNVQLCGTMMQQKLFMAIFEVLAACAAKMATLAAVYRPNLDFTGPLVDPAAKSFLKSFELDFCVRMANDLELMARYFEEYVQNSREGMRDLPWGDSVGAFHNRLGMTWQALVSSQLRVLDVIAAMIFDVADRDLEGNFRLTSQFFTPMWEQNENDSRGGVIHWLCAQCLHYFEKLRQDEGFPSRDFVIDHIHGRLRQRMVETYLRRLVDACKNLVACGCFPVSYKWTKKRTKCLFRDINHMDDTLSHWPGWKHLFKLLQTVQNFVMADVRGMENVMRHAVLTNPQLGVHYYLLGQLLVPARSDVSSNDWRRISEGLRNVVREELSGIPQLERGDVHTVSTQWDSKKASQETLAALHSHEDVADAVGMIFGPAAGDAHTYHDATRGDRQAEVEMSSPGGGARADGRTQAETSVRGGGDRRTEAEMSSVTNETPVAGAGWDDDTADDAGPKAVNVEEQDDERKGRVQQMRAGGALMVDGADTRA